MLFFGLGGKTWIAMVVIQRSGPDDVAVLQDLMLLRARERVSIGCLGDLQAGGKPRALRGAQSIGVEADFDVTLAAHLPCSISAITEVNRNGAFSMPGLIQTGRDHVRPAKRHSTTSTP